jgi:hypothetical protein
MVTHRVYVTSYMEEVSGIIEDQLANLAGNDLQVEQLKDPDWVNSSRKPGLSVSNEWLSDSDFPFAVADEYGYGA